MVMLNKHLECRRGWFEVMNLESINAYMAFKGSEYMRSPGGGVRMEERREVRSEPCALQCSEVRKTRGL